MRVLAFDPGETTGWALVDSETENRTFLSGEFPAFSWAAKLVNGYEPDVAVVEAFRLYPSRAKAQSWSTFPAVEVIGVIKFVCQKANVPIVFQNASLAKSIWVDCDQGAINKHAYDALRHALIWLRRNGNGDNFSDIIRFTRSKKGKGTSASNKRT